MIKNKEMYLNNIWNWDFINEVLPGKVAVSDIDGAIEHNGWLFAIETKDTKNYTIPVGQHILYSSMVRSGVMTVLFLFGKTNKPEYAELWLSQEWGQPCTDFKVLKGPVNAEWVKETVANWYAKAGQRKVNYNVEIKF